MSFLSEPIYADELPQSTNNFKPLPEGWYTASISSAEAKDTKAKTGRYIAIKYTITGPTHQGRTVFGNLNIKNPNPKAEEIGRQQLGEVMRAIGLTKVTDTDELIGGNLSIKLVIKPAEGQYEESNEIKGFKSQSGSIPATSASSASSASTASTDSTASTKSAPPWAKK